MRVLYYVVDPPGSRHYYKQNFAF